MDFVVTRFTHYQGFAPFRYHRTFPRFFAFQVFDLVDVMNFIAKAIRSTAQFANFRLQPFFDGVGCIAKDYIQV